MRGVRSIRTPAVIGTLVLTLAAPAFAAQPSVFDDYAPDGVIDPCKHSTAQLQKALDTVPPDVEQYAAEYPAALEAALEARARGACGGGPAPSGTGGDGGATPPASSGGTPAPTADPATTGGEVVPAPPGPADAATPAPDADVQRATGRTDGSDAPLPVVLLLALVAVIALAVVCSLVMRRLGLADDRLAPAAHAWREAAWRAGGTWADLRDWVRLGR